MGSMKKTHRISSRFAGPEKCRLGPASRVEGFWGSRHAEWPHIRRQRRLHCSTRKQAPIPASIWYVVSGTSSRRVICRERHFLQARHVASEVECTTSVEVPNGSTLLFVEDAVLASIPRYPGLFALAPSARPRRINPLVGSFVSSVNDWPQRRHRDRPEDRALARAIVSEKQVDVGKSGSRQNPKPVLIR